MVAVFIPALILEIFTTYFIIKTVTQKLSIEIWIWGDFILWNVYLVVPKFVAICLGAITKSEGQKLSNQLGKSSNFCCDVESLQRVSWKSFRSYFGIQQSLQMNALSHKLQNRPITLTCGFFNIDWPLALSILGTITTYMVIICQFEKDY